jgi:hypothetical protein
MGTTYESKEYDQFGMVIVRRYQEDDSPTPGGDHSYYTSPRPDLKPPPKDARPLDDWRRFRWVRLV